MERKHQKHIPHWPYTKKTEVLNLHTRLLSFFCIRLTANVSAGRLAVWLPGLRYFDAEKAVLMHIAAEHGSVFDCLIAQDKKRTGLTEVQKDLMNFFYQGLSDKEIAARTGTSASTVRFQRYNLREKAKQAKIYLVLAELMEENMKKGSELIPEIHAGATMVDERYMVTPDESDKILKQYFEPGPELKLKVFPPKEKKKLVILKRIVSVFEGGIKYSEKQVNEKLMAIYDDYATIRRYLLEYGFMDRTKDCREYWLKM